MKKGKSGSTMLLLVAPTVIAVILATALMHWRVPTRIRLDAVVGRVLFTVGGSGPVAILNSIRFQSISIEQFARFKFSPEKIEVADPERYDVRENAYPRSAWTLVAANQPLEMSGEEETLQPTITLESAKEPEASIGAIDVVSVETGAAVSVEVAGAKGKNLSLRVVEKEPRMALSVDGPIQLIASHVKASGVSKTPYGADVLTYRVIPSRDDRVIEILGRHDTLAVNFTISTKQASSPFSKSGIPVTSLDFTSQDSAGNHVSTLLTGGYLSYDDYPQMERVAFAPPDFLGLGQLGKCRIEEMTQDEERQGIRLVINCVAGHATIGSPEFPRDCRLSLFDILRQSPRLIVLASMVAWVFPTTVGGYKLYKEIRS